MSASVEDVLPQNVAELSEMLINECPELLDKRLNTNAARTTVFRILLLNAWRRRRSDAEKSAGLVVDLQKKLLQTKEQKATVETLLRFEQQRYKKLNDVVESMKSENEVLSVQLADRISENTNLRNELEAKIRATEQLLHDVQTMQQQLADTSATEHELHTKIDQYKFALSEMQCANRELEAKIDQLLHTIVELERTCDENERTIQRKEAEMMRLHALIDGAFLTRIRNLARHCFMVTSASLYRVSHHMLPAMPVFPNMFETVGPRAQAAAIGAHGDKTKKCDIPFVIATPLLTVKTMTK